MKPGHHTKHAFQDIAYTVSGILVMGFALKGFMVPNNFLDGGVTGVSLLAHELFDLNLSYTLVLANIPLIIMGYFIIGRKFAIKTFLAVIGVALCLRYIPYPVVTSNLLMVSIFGGFSLGVGVGLSMRGGCALDGIEVLALYTLKRSNFSISEIILGINVIIFLIAALFFGLPTALYSMLTYFTASRTINYIIEGLEEYNGVTIISGKSEEIKERLVMELKKGITVYKGERGFMKDSFEVSQDCDIVFTIATRFEVRRLKNMVHDVDPKAFIFTNTIKEAAGGVLKARAH